MTIVIVVSKIYRQIVKIGFLMDRMSKVFDRLAYAIEAYARAERGINSKPKINSAYSDYKQQEFIGFILDKYIEGGVHELAANKTRSLIELKYNIINDATNVFRPLLLFAIRLMGFRSICCGMRLRGVS